MQTRSTRARKARLLGPLRSAPGPRPHRRAGRNNHPRALAETFTPADAVAAGFLDRTVEASSVREVARGVAAQLATLDRSAHEAIKRRARAQALSAIRSAIDADAAEYQVRASAS
jgi:enoyl-CoA hydratase/carnithine racemase